MTPHGPSTGSSVIDPRFVVSDETTLRGLFHEVTPLAAQKSMTFLDEHARSFISRSPFLCLGTQNANGLADVSPRGDPPGFVSILDSTTLAIPDRPGNNRLDSQVNILTNANVGLLFIIPGFDDTLRVNGRATLSVDPKVLEKLAVKGRIPKIAILVSVREVFLHCAKAFRRSRLWADSSQTDRTELPSLSTMILDQTTGVPPSAEEAQRLDAALETEYAKTLY